MFETIVLILKLNKFIFVMFKERIKLTFGDSVVLLPVFDVVFPNFLAFE